MVTVAFFLFGLVINVLAAKYHEYVTNNANITQIQVYFHTIYCLCQARNTIAMYIVSLYKTGLLSLFLLPFMVLYWYIHVSVHT